MRERFDDERAADRAVAAVVRSGLFETAARTTFPCNRVMPTCHEFQAWLEHFVSLQKLPPHDWLLRRVERAFSEGSGPPRIVVSAPMDLWLLRRRAQAEAGAPPAGRERGPRLGRRSPSRESSR
jgi:hypothetical protein